MAIFHLHFNDGREIVPGEIGIEFESLERAYLEVRAAIPDMARDLLLQGRDPLAATYVITDAGGRSLLVVPFSEVLSPKEWRIARARRRPHGGPRSVPSRDAQALASFRQMFGAVNAGCVLLTPDMEVVEMNAFGAQHSHVDPEAIRGRPIFEIFSELKGEAKANFDRFMTLPRSGVVSEVLDLPYLVLDAEGRTANGWWDARVWPIFDDDHRILGFVEWATPRTAPTHGGQTVVRVSPPVSS